MLEQGARYQPESDEHKDQRDRRPQDVLRPGPIHREPGSGAVRRLLPFLLELLFVIEGRCGGAERELVGQVVGGGEVVEGNAVDGGER